MGSFRIATRYAKSLIQLAQEKNVLDKVSADVKSVDSILDASRELQLVFNSPIIPTDKKLAIVKKIFEGKVDGMLYQFMILLIKKGREKFLHEVAEEFAVQYNVIRGVTPVKLISAVKLDSGVVQTMVRNLKAKEFLKEVELHEEIDPDLVGGFIIQYGDKQIDQSVQTRLTELYNLMTDQSYVKKLSY